MKCGRHGLQGGGQQSHPARGAWIEMKSATVTVSYTNGRTPQGVRGLKSLTVPLFAFRRSRTPQGVRGLKSKRRHGDRAPQRVAPRKGCVD